MEGLNWVQIRPSLKQVEVKQFYNPVLQEVRVSCSEFGVSGCRSKQWEQDPAENWALRTPGWAARRTRKKCYYSWKSWGSICWDFVLSPTHLSHITLSQPFRINCESYIFLKNCFVHHYWVDYVSACIWVCYSIKTNELTSNKGMN